MTLKTYLTMMLLATAICWAAFVLVLTTVNPFKTNTIGFLLFYASLFLAVLGSGAVIGFIIRFIALKQELVFRQVAIAFRQAFSLAILVVALLILQSCRMLTWWNILLLITAVTMMEFFLISYRRI